MYSLEFLVLDNYFSSTCKRKDLKEAWLIIRTKLVEIKNTTTNSQSNIMPISCTKCCWCGQCKHDYGNSGCLDLLGVE